jgi:outer membrane receptor for ferrienterochelin and colicins
MKSSNVLTSPILPALTVLASLISSLGASLCWAQGAGEANDPGLPTVTIRANRQTLQERFEAPGSRVIVGRDDIEQMGADTVSDVLRQLPGVLATTSADGRTEIRMRGMDRSATQILVDGERTSNGRRGGQLPFDQIPSELIERIEVIRSPTPEFTGASAGTINIVLKQSTIQRETNARITNQFFNDRNAAQVFVSRTGPVSELTPEELAKPVEIRPIPTTYFWMLSAYERLGGVDRVGNTSNSLKPDYDTKTDESRSRTREVLLIPRFTIKPNFKDTWTINPLLIVTRSTASVEGLTDGLSSRGPFTTRSAEVTTTERTLARVSTTWAHRFTNNRLETRGSIERGTEKTLREATVATEVTGLTPSSSSIQQTLNDERAETVWNLATKLQGFEDAKVWALGAEIDHRVLTANTITEVNGTSALGPLDYRAKQLRTAVWGQNEWTVFSKSTLVGGLRLEDLKRDTTGTNISRTDEWVRWQPSLNLRTPINPGLQFRAGVAQTTRVPALLDVIDRTVPSTGINSATRPDAKGNPLLRPETTLSFDIGIEMRVGSDAPAVAPNQGASAAGAPSAGVREGQGRRAGAPSAAPTAIGQAGINLFAREIRDPIVRRTEFSGDRWVQTPLNGENGRAWGIEGDFKIPLSLIGINGWNFNSNASIFKSNIDLGRGVFGRIPGQPYYLVNMSVAKPIPRTGGTFGGASLNITGATKLADSAASGGQSSYVARLDGYVGQVIPNFGYLRLGVYNLNNAGRNRVRTDTDSVQNVRTEQIVERAGRSVFLTFGTRF